MLQSRSKNMPLKRKNNKINLELSLGAKLCMKMKNQKLKKTVKGITVIKI